MLRWAVMASVYAEAYGIDKDLSLDLPIIGSFGPPFEKFFQHVVGTIGNYNEIYERNLGNVMPRSGRNMLNKNPQTTIQGPSVYVPPGFGF